MPSYYHDRRHRDGYELAHHIERDLRHSHRPTRYIVNEGKLIIDERSLEARDHHHHRDHYRSSSSRANTVIYNAPGSTMWIESQHDKNLRTECRGCYRRRERLYDGYCADCVSLRIDTPRRHEVVNFSDRRLLDYPSRRAIGWR
ncbi:hypothetical protein F4802DRAFT_527324 [Xylaria palmicola]|nr:hypothetical protein F4802DRAFT_527324 [Xylaria palmicola]